MRTALILLCSLLSTGLGLAQQLTCSPTNKSLVTNKIEQVALALDSDFGLTLANVGKTFLKTPYVAKTLEVGKTETLVVNLQGLDCTTFIENALALSIMLKNNETAFLDFTKTLRHIRYKDGKLDGYGSRLHYFTDWVRSNEAKGFVEDITNSIGGVMAEKNINFMGTHRELYPFLVDDSNYEKILATEEALAKQPFCYVPQDNIAANEHLIKTGDIIALATSINGLDVTHTGIAVRQANGRIHLLHASTNSMEVEITKKPLAEYIKGVKNNIGITVARPKAP